MSMTRTEALQLFLALFPEGYDQVMDTAPGTNFSKFAYAASGGLKTYGSDVIDTLRLEINPGTCTQKIPDWESALGLTESPTAKFGTIAQRRNAIIAWLRQSGSFSLADIRAAMQPFFLYADPSAIQIIEASRSALTTQHTRAGAGFSVAGPGVTEQYVAVLDDPRTSPGGVTVTVSLTCTNIEQLYIAVDAPDGRRAGMAPGALGQGSVTGVTFVLHFQTLAGSSILGNWGLLVGCTGAAGATINSWSLALEALGVNYRGAPPVRSGEGLGAAMFYFAVVADEDLLGTGYDLVGALRALKRLKPAHTDCTIVWRESGALDTCAIPDTRSATVDAAIPCS